MARSNAGEEYEAIVARAVASAPFGFLVIDAGGTITAAEGQLDRLLGASPAEVRSRSAFELFARLAGVNGALRRALAGETVVVVVDVDAEASSWEVRLAPIRDPDGTVSGAVGAVTDQTARRRAEIEAERNLWFLDALVENIPDMIFVKDAEDLRFVRFNRAGEELLGYDREDLIGKNDHDFFPRPEADSFTSKDRVVLSEGKLVDIPEETIHTRERGVRVLRTKKIPIQDHEGRPIYLLGISEDITERKQVEAERHRLYERMQEVDRLKTRLIANVSHEFRTPLAVIHAFSSRLQQEASGVLDPADLEGIERSVYKLLRLVDDLLDVARMEAGKLAVDHVEVDLARLVRLWASAFEVLAERRNQALIVETPDTLTAQIDARKLERVIDNLLSNACRHAPDGGRVRCSLLTLDDRVGIEVADSGEGVAPDFRDQVFERFYQIEAEPGRAAGTGLGLAIAREFVALHGGTIEIEQAPEGGALFRAELPRFAPEGAKVRPARPEAGLVPSPRTAPVRAEIGERADRALVLVVEDHPELNSFLVQTLRSRYRVATAFDGEEGLRLALEVHPDLILTDIMMPRMGGEALLFEARRRSELCEVPIVFLTARADDELRIQLLRAGAADYVMKPFATEELMARLGNLLALKRSRDLLREALSSSLEDVEELSRELAQRRVELEEAVHQREEFLFIASHELNGPMTSLMLMLQGLRAAIDQGLDPARQTRMIELAERQGRRMTRLIEELLDVTRIARSGLSIAREECDLAAVVRDTVGAYAPELERAGCVVAIGGEESVIGAFDPSRIEQVVLNLLANAVKFGAGKPIEITVGVDGDIAWLSVRDEGLGIPFEKQREIFELFARAVSTRNYGGLGLGLYVSREIVQAHGGTIRVDSRPGAGAVFTVELPRAEVSR